MFGISCALSYRWFALGVSFDVLFGGGFALSYPIAGSRLVLVLDAVFGGGFVLSLYRWFALGVGFGRCVWWRLRLILSFFALGVSFGRCVRGAVLSYPIVGSH